MSKEKIRKVFLDDLPMKDSRIDWKNSIGYKVPFIYDDIEGEVEIISFANKESSKIIIKYLNNQPFEIRVKNFKKCQLGRILNKKTKDFKVEIGTSFKDDKRDLIITDREYRKDKVGKVWKWYKYTCKVCGWTEGWIVESSLLEQGTGCASCSGQVVTPMNNIWNNARWMCDLGVSEEDAKSHTRCSGQKVEVTCPDCGKKKKVIIYNIYKNKSISCKCSSDGTSYPEKFMMSVLNQLGIEFIAQLSKSTFDWCDKYRYDFYIPSLNMIIETHGMQHYKGNVNFRMSLNEVKENDKLKREVAVKNGINKYIIVDCKNSEFDWMAFNCYKSLKDYFDMNNINFGKAEEFALKNIIKEVCEYWNNKEEWETTQTIADNNEWGIKGRNTIRRYLKKGTNLGWCNYNANYEVEKVALRNGERSKKKVEMFKNGVSLGVFESASELERQSEKLFGTKLFYGCISRVCLGKAEQYKGYTFKHVTI